MSTRRSSEALARQAAAQRARYKEMGPQMRRILRERVRKVKAERGPIINAIKLESGCVDCGYRAHPAALHFDHRDPSTKTFAISKGTTRSWESILEEIAKCEVRCANCHAIRSVNEGHLGRPLIDEVEAAPVVVGELEADLLLFGEDVA